MTGHEVFTVLAYGHAPQRKRRGIHSRCAWRSMRCVVSAWANVPAGVTKYATARPRIAPCGLCGGWSWPSRRVGRKMPTRRKTEICYLRGTTIIVENLDVESWEELAANASRQHEENLVQKNNLQRHRAVAALQGMMTGELDATREIDDELCAVEARIVGHTQTRQLIQSGLDAAIEIQSADATLEKIALTRTAAAKRAELAATVDSGLESLATAVTLFLDAQDGTRPDRAAGNLNRAFWAAFAGTRNRQAWWRQCITGLSESPHSMASVAPLSGVVDSSIREADAMETAALKRREEAHAALKALTPAMTTPTGKSRPKRAAAAELEAA